MSSRQNTARAMSMVRLAGLGLAVALIGGCGGNATSTPAPPPPDTPADFLSAATVSSDNTQGKTLLVFDPAAPNPPRLAIPLSATDNHQTTYLTKVDPATGAYTIIGTSNVVYVQNGMTYQVNLRKTSANTPTRISSLSNACSLDGAATEAMLTVTEAGPDGECATTADNGVVYVRLSDAITTPPLSLPAGVTLLEALPDASYTATLFVLARDNRGSTPKLTLYSPTLTLVGDVTGGQGVTDFQMAYNLSQPIMGTYAYADATLRQLTWSATGATLSASLHNFTTPLTQDDFRYLSDANSFYFTDGLAVHRITGNAAPVLLTTLDAALGDSATLSLATADHLVLRQWSSSGTTPDSLRSLSKQGGTALTLVTSPSTYALGHAGDNVFYEAFAWTSSATTATVRRIGIDGSNDTLIVDQADGFVMPMLPRVFSLHDLQYTSFMWCERAAGDSNCSNGSLKLYNIGTGITNTLGQLSHAGAYSSWNPFRGSLEFLFIDTPIVLRSEGRVQGSSAVENEVYVAQPGVANSLVRVTPGP